MKQTSDHIRYSMVASGHVAKGAIYSKAGDSAWAQSPGFDVRYITTTPSRHIQQGGILYETIASIENARIREFNLTNLKTTGQAQ